MKFTTLKEKAAHQDDLDKAIEAISSGLDVIARVQSLIQIDNVYREMQEFLHDLRQIRADVETKLNVRVE